MWTEEADDLACGWQDGMHVYVMLAIYWLSPLMFDIGISP